VNSTLSSADSSQQLGAIGWREWVSLQKLGIDQVKAKVDTGARTSALHAFDIQYFDEGNGLMVRFQVHPLQRNTDLTVRAIAPVLEKRHVRNSGGHAQERPVIKTPILLGDQSWDIELTLTNRDVMGFRMLIGREAVRRRFLVDPGGSYLKSLRSHHSSMPSDEIDEPDFP
jgi:hypothetical protein